MAAEITKIYKQEKHYAKKESAKRKERDKKIFQGITLVALAFLWAGVGYGLLTENAGNISTYSPMILVFSLLNADVLFTKEKAGNKALNIIAKLSGVLFFILTVVTIVSLLLK